MRKLFLTPPAIPAEDQCRGLVLPASQEWLGVYSKALLQTTYAYNYEQVYDTDLTPEQAASEAYTRYVAWLAAECGGAGACITPAGSKVYRVNPTTHHYEYLEGEEWIPEPDAPALPAREEPTEAERICAAASNAVHVLMLTWQEGMAQWDANVAAEDALIDQIAALSAIVGSWFYPPMLGLAGLLTLGWEITYGAYQVLTAVDWDEELTRLLVCVFQEHATQLDGAVYFSPEAIMHELWGMAFSGQAYLTIVSQLQWMMSTIGPEAINMAGSLDIVPGDCDCEGPWGREWAYAQMWAGGEWAIIQGVVDSANKVQGTGTWPGTYAAIQSTVYVSDNTHFTKVSADFFVASPGYYQFFITEGPTPWIHSGGPDDAVYSIPPNWVWQEGPWHTGSIYQDWTVSHDGANEDMTLTFALRNNQTLNRIRIYGTGPCPFTSGTPV